MPDKPTTLPPGDCVRLVLAGLGLQRVSMATLTAAVLEEHPNLSVSQVYAGVGVEMRAGRAEMRVNPESGIVYVQRRTAVEGEDLTSWTLANDLALTRLVDRVEEVIDDALVKAGAGKLGVKVMALVHSLLVLDLSQVLELERGTAVEVYVRESGTHPADVRRRAVTAAVDGLRDPRRTNPPAAGRFTQ